MTHPHLRISPLRKIVIAPDSFKESLDAFSVADAIERGFKTILPDLDYVKLPLADGGEGLLRVLLNAHRGKQMTCVCTGPRGEPITATYGLIDNGQTAIIETAAVAGLQLLEQQQRDPRYTTSYGVGELIKDALDKGFTRLLIGLGGSASNDAGAGMLQALGVRLFDQHGKPLARGGAALANLARIDVQHLDPRLQSVNIDVACDVSNPLCGRNGAT